MLWHYIDCQNFKNCGHESWKHAHFGFGFSDSIRLTMSKSISTQNFVKIGHLSPRLCYYDFWFEKTDIGHTLIAIILPVSIWPIDRAGIGILHRRTKFTISSSIRSRGMKVSQNYKSRSRDPFPIHLTKFIISFVSSPGGKSAWEIWSVSQHFKRRSREPFMTPFNLILHFFFWYSGGKYASRIWSF